MNLRVGLIQQEGTGTTEAIWARTEQAIEAAHTQGAQLILLQELHTGPYFCQNEEPNAFAYAETIPGPSSQRLASLARRFSVVIVGSLFERRAPGLFHNTAVVFERDGTLVGRYRKMHIPDDPGFYEKYYFTPGDLGFHPIATSVGRLGVLVCWDQWYPEAARLMTLGGADLLLYPTAIGWDPRDDTTEQQRQKEAWELVQRGHAVANGLPLLTCNRCGLEEDPSAHTPGVEFWGGSFVCGPQGEWLARAQTSATVLLADIDMTRTETVRRIWPFLRDRRIDAYEDLIRRYRD